MKVFGQICITLKVKEDISENEKFEKEIHECLKRYKVCDWGDLCDTDWKRNDEALKSGARIFAAYITSMGKVWIITEPDRSATTILYSGEY